ncbi:hypothetical protein ACRRS0_09875 [Agarivorans sp. QJM3NY_29]|uniref:hypothetical protein n=1 Tax=unclassified Agarivorans TaxID=2636026 RepID=UPI003D7CF6FE
MKKLIVPSFIALLAGCQVTPNQLTSDIDVSSNFKETNIPVGTYVLAINSYNDEQDIQNQTYGPSIECAKYIINDLTKYGFKRVYNQQNADYIIGFNCNFKVFIHDEGYTAEANYGDDFKTSNSRIISTTGAGSLNVHSNSIDTKITSFDIKNASSSHIISTAGIAIYKNHDAFSYRDRELLWAGSAISQSFSSQKDKRVANNKDLIQSVLTQFNNKENSGDFHGHPNKVITLPYLADTNSINEEQANKPFLYTMEVDWNKRNQALGYNEYFYKPWQTIYDGGKRIVYKGEKDDLLAISTESFVNEGKGGVVTLTFGCPSKSPILSIIFRKESLDVGSLYDVYIYDGYEHSKIKVQASATDHSLVFVATSEIIEVLASGNGRNKDYVTVVLPDLNKEIEFRKEGFEEAMTIAYPECN